MVAAVAAVASYVASWRFSSLLAAALLLLRAAAAAAAAAAAGLHTHEYFLSLLLWAPLVFVFNFVLSFTVSFRLFTVSLLSVHCLLAAFTVSFHLCLSPLHQ